MLNIQSDITFFEPSTLTFLQSKNELQTYDDKKLSDQKFLKIPLINRKKRQHLLLNSIQRNTQSVNFDGSCFQSPTRLLNNVQIFISGKNQKIEGQNGALQMESPLYNEKIQLNQKILLFDIGLLKQQNQILKAKIKQLVQFQNQSIAALASQLSAINNLWQKKMEDELVQYNKTKQQLERLQIICYQYVNNIKILQKKLSDSKQNESILLNQIKQQKKRTLKQQITLKQNLLGQTKLNKRLQYQIFELRQQVKYYKKQKIMCKCIKEDSLNETNVQNSQNGQDKTSIQKRESNISQNLRQKIQNGFHSVQFSSKPNIMGPYSTQSCKQIFEPTSKKTNIFENLQNSSNKKLIKVGSLGNQFNQGKMEDKLRIIKNKIQQVKQEVVSCQK